MLLIIPTYALPKILAYALYILVITDTIHFDVATRSVHILPAQLYLQQFLRLFLLLLIFIE